ncbi:MAG: hypothetical protein Q8829_02865, partial [Candidatus Phytoplasma australasiaticum]|nr:hypothetical protein [Candidatus Phytoplasma australasiaticum]
QESFALEKFLSSLTNIKNTQSIKRNLLKRGDIEGGGECVFGVFILFLNYFGFEQSKSNLVVRCVKIEIKHATMNNTNLSKLTYFYIKN